MKFQLSIKTVIKYYQNFLIGISLGITAITTLANLENYDSRHGVIVMSLVSTSFCMLLVLFKENSELRRFKLQRLLAAVLIAMFFYFTPYAEIVKLKFRNHPELTNAILDYDANPSFKNQQRILEEYNKVDKD